MKKLIVVGLLLLVTACTSDLNPVQEALVANKAYQAAGNGVLACLKQPACEAKAGDELRAADTVAFNVVKQTTTQAQVWFNAPDAEKPAAVSVFENILKAAQDSTNQLTALLAKYMGGN